MAKATVKSKLDRYIPIILIVVGVLGALMALIITQEKFHLAENPNYKPSCSINPIVSCGSVMQSDQANAFGFPNPFIGLIGFPVLVTAGVVLLAGAQLKRWFWLGLNAGLFFGIGFVHWLFYQSVYNINALCPYCIVVWIVTITAFIYITLYNLRHKNLVAPKALQPAVKFLNNHHLDILILWLLLIAFFTIKHFWYYFGQNLPF
jgi:uncharacterized membrane protein